MSLPFPEKSNLILPIAVLCLLVALNFLPAQARGETQQDQTEQEETRESAAPQESGSPGETARMEPVVVTATRVETPLSQVTKSVSVVTPENRDEQQEYFLPELIDNEPGVYLRRLGGPGQWSNISIRGAGSQHIQYQYNGFPLRDAADTQTTIQYFIEDLYSASNLKQVEILRGTQSTLYGSQAMGGVINIISDKWKRGTGAEVRSEFSEFGTFLENGRFFHGQDQFYLDFNPVYITTDGRKNGGDYGYYYENLGFAAGAGFRFTPDITLEFSSLYSDTDLALSKTTPSLDAGGNLVKNTADPDKHREGLLAQHGLTMNHSVSSCWNYSLKGAYTETQRHYFWSPTAGDQSNYDGSTAYLETQHNFRITDWFSLIAGLDYEQSYYDGREPRDPNKGDFSPVLFKKNWYTWDAFGLAGFKLLDESLFLNLGARFNDHEAFDSKLVGEASAAYIFKRLGTKIHAQVGSGYRTPGLYEIYGGYLYQGSLIIIGNPDLQPEKSLGYEFGVEQPVFGERVKLGITWFHTDFDDLITYDGLANKYINADKARSEGIETYATVMPWEWMKLNFAYTYTDSEYERNDQAQWVRREYLPRNKISGALTVLLPHNFTASVKAIWQDEKIVPLYDASWNSVRWVEPSVVTVDAAVTCTVLKKYQAFLKVENLLDEDYTESAYVMPGRTVSGGLKLSF
jgi:vitamin B12 transporter